MRSYKITRDKLLVLMHDEMKDLLKDKECDHANAVCYCTARELLKRTDKFLKLSKRSKYI